METRQLINMLGGIDGLSRALSSQGCRVSPHGVKKWRTRGLPNDFRLRITLMQLVAGGELEPDVEAEATALLRRTD